MEKRKKISFKKILSKEEKKKEAAPKETKVPKKEPIVAAKPVTKIEPVVKEEPAEKGKPGKKKPAEQKEIIKEPKREEIMIVRVEKEFYGIPLSNVEEIRREINLTSTPQLSGFLSGIAEIRDLIIPVVNFGQLFGISIEDKKTKKIPVIVVQISKQLVGLQVSEIVEIKEVQKNEILSLPDIFPPKLFSGGYSYKSIVVGILNVESLLKGKQIQSFKEKINEVIK
jgi:purine-binding chemotaxis protein CheW